MNRRVTGFYDKVNGKIIPIEKCNKRQLLEVIRDLEKSLPKVQD